MKTIVLYTFDVIMLFHISLPSRPSINTLYVMVYRERIAVFGAER